MSRLRGGYSQAREVKQPPMTRARSIRVRLSVVFLFLFLLVIVLGVEALRSLSYVNDASAEIRLRWLPSTRALGDLNNLTTDYPAAETNLLRAASPSDRATALHQMADLDRGIVGAELAYRTIRHDAAEDALYERFESKWKEYRSIVRRGPQPGMGVADDAMKPPQAQESKSAYDAASAPLGTLTDLISASARRGQRGFGSRL